MTTTRHAHHPSLEAAGCVINLGSHDFLIVLIDEMSSSESYFGFIHLDLSTRDGTFAGIDPNWMEMGRIAANQIIDQLNRNEVGVPKHPIVTLVLGDWVDGATLPRRRQVAAGY